MRILVAVLGGVLLLIGVILAGLTLVGFNGLNEYGFSVQGTCSSRPGSGQGTAEEQCSYDGFNNMGGLKYVIFGVGLTIGGSVMLAGAAAGSGGGRASSAAQPVGYPPQQPYPHG